MTIAYVLQHEGQWNNENSYLAYRGFHHRGYEVRPYTAQEMSAGLLPLSRDMIVCGGIQQVQAALKQLGVRYPLFETYPHSLRRFMDRPPSAVRISSILEAFQAPGFKPCFIKPQTDHKLFTGLVVSQFSDLLQFIHDPDTSVWKLPVIQWISEYRAFIHKGELIGMRHYKGDPLVFPDASVVRKMISTASKTMLETAFSIDVGIANFPARPELIRTPTLLVEANDAHSLGAYGLPSHIYSQMIEDRWRQMVGT